MNRVYVVTNVEYGWDCIVGVFDHNNVSLEDLEAMFSRKNGYIIFDKEVQTDLNEYD